MSIQTGPTLGAHTMAFHPLLVGGIRRTVKTDGNTAGNTSLPRSQDDVADVGGACVESRPQVLKRLAAIVAGTRIARGWLIAEQFAQEAHLPLL